MKYSGLMFASLALCSTAGYAANQATFSDGILHMPHVSYLGSMYDVKMKLQGADKLVLVSADPLSNMPDSKVVSVSEKLSFTLSDISVGGANYRADVKSTDGEFVVSSVGLATHGKMFKGEMITNLGIHADKGRSRAYGISDDGSIISGKSREGRPYLPARFDYGQETIEVLKGLGGGRVEARAINNAGTIAGFDTIETEDGSRVYHSFYNISGSETQEIARLGEGSESRAYGINNNGMIVGWSNSLADNSDHVAYSFDTATGTLSPLEGEMLGGARSFAFAINDSGQIAGVATTADASALAFIYKDGVAVNLGSLDNSGYSEARAINDKGVAAGWSLTSSGTYAAFTSDGTSMQAITGLGGDTKAYGINTHGTVVGSAKDAEDGDHAFVYKDGAFQDLYEMLPAADKENWEELRIAYSISDNGIVVGRGKYWTDKANEKSSDRAFRIQL